MKVGQREGTHSTERERQVCGVESKRSWRQTVRLSPTMLVSLVELPQLKEFDWLANFLWLFCSKL